MQKAFMLFEFVQCMGIYPSFKGCIMVSLPLMPHPTTYKNLRSNCAIRFSSPMVDKVIPKRSICRLIFRFGSMCVLSKQKQILQIIATLHELNGVFKIYLKHSTSPHIIYKSIVPHIAHLQDITIFLKILGKIENPIVPDSFVYFVKDQYLNVR